MSICTYWQDRQLGEVLQGFPLSLKIIQIAHDHARPQLVVVKVAGSQRHDKVTQTNERRAGVSKETHHHMIGQTRQHGLVTILEQKEFLYLLSCQ